MLPPKIAERNSVRSEIRYAPILARRLSYAEESEGNQIDQNQIADTDGSHGK